MSLFSSCRSSLLKIDNFVDFAAAEAAKTGKSKGKSAAAPETERVAAALQAARTPRRMLVSFPSISDAATPKVKSEPKSREPTGPRRTTRARAAAEDDEVPVKEGEEEEEAAAAAAAPAGGR